MNLYTMGSSQNPAKEFFNKINQNNINLLIDIRLNNQSQLLGFTKGRDLEFFLYEISNCAYVHEPLFAPTKEILNGFKKKETSWENYVNSYDYLVKKRRMLDIFEKKYFDKYDNILLLCSEVEIDFCHRRLLAEKLEKYFKIHTNHL
ncbi:MAG: DUF488 family protein, N3 subclade [Methanobacteriaceae archaeon]